MGVRLTILHERRPLPQPFSQNGRGERDQDRFPLAHPLGEGVRELRDCKTLERTRTMA